MCAAPSRAICRRSWSTSCRQHPEQLKLGGELRELTLMFSDIRGFTKLSEGLDPQRLTTVINSFLTPMTRVIQNRQGTIDKYIGDCIMAFWNAPIDVEPHGRMAILAAYDMREELIRINQRFAEEAARTGDKLDRDQIGIGLNSGICCVGNMGSDQRFDYSVLGDTVNIASRLESLSPAYFVDLVIGEETALGRPRLRPPRTRPGAGEGQERAGAHLYRPWRREGRQDRTASSA